MIRGVPYDHELEYSQGSQSASAVDIGVQMASVGRIRFGYSFVAVGASVTMDDAFQSRAGELGIDCYVMFNPRTRRLVQTLYGPGGASYALGTITQQTWFDVTIDCDADSATINGVTYPAASHSVVYDQDRIYLHAGFHHSRGKMYYFKTWDLNGNPQRDMVPVSDGSGRVYWYDRITRRAFFPTKAELVAGPVASTPLMGVHFYNPVSTALYTQNLYNAMWDGIENDGPGKHSQFLANWKDLSGSGRDLIVNQSGIAIYENRLKNDTNWIARTPTAFDFQSATAVFRYNHEKTNMVFVARDSNFAYIQTSSDGSIGLSQRIHNSTSQEYAGIKIPHPENLDIVSVTVNFKTTNYFGAYEVWVNGTPFTITNNSPMYNNAAGGLCTGARGGTSPNLPTGCELFHLRFAPRPVTEAEMLRDLKVDRMRFNIQQTGALT